MRYVVPFADIRAVDIEAVGGKGANLGELTAAGFNVPSGFCVTTAAYRRFLAAHPDSEGMFSSLDSLQANDVEATRTAAAQVRSSLQSLPIPPDLEQEVIEAWKHLGEEGAYAVRSSATAEDLPDASFAGQQDTFLNVLGAEALLDRIRGCWISLFTDRAVTYRIRNGFSHRAVALSAIVQRMAPADVSGIVFTADPVSGRRHITTIDASFGLGEALVAGLVTADAYQIDTRTYSLASLKIGEKQVAIRSMQGGGVTRETLKASVSSGESLSEAQAIALARLGQEIERHYGTPQDIEWSLGADGFYILQSRPITSLFPIPARALEMEQRTGELQITFSFGAVQGMLDPMTKLGQDTISGIFAGAGELFGYHNEPIAPSKVVWEAAERLFINMTSLMRHRIGRELMHRAMSFIEPGGSQVLGVLLEDSRLAPAGSTLRAGTLFHIFRLALPTVGRLLIVMLHPDDRRRSFQRDTDSFVEEAYRLAAASTTLGDAIRAHELTIKRAFWELLPKFLPGMAAGMMSLSVLRRIAGSDEKALVFTRGLPHNVTTEMDLALWETAEAIHGDEASLRAFEREEAKTLATKFLNEELPPIAMAAVGAFMKQYGMRGIGEIDFGRPRWRDDPSQIMGVLKGYVRIEDPEAAPDTVFSRGAAEADAGIALLIKEIRSTRGGRLKASLARVAYRRVRALFGLRESPKFTIVRALGLTREALLKQGRALVKSGVIEREDDLFWMHISELKRLDGGEKDGWREKIAERRRIHAREQLRHQIPRILLSDGHAFYEGYRAGDDSVGDSLTGSAVSPGIAEGMVVVVADPVGVQLPQGAILVCAGTDPAWTPLFLSAGGLVTEVGGLMTHGSVVAREYGIPAVVGVHQATTRLETGQRVRVDGSAGTVTLLDAGE